MRKYFTLLFVLVLVTLSAQDNTIKYKTSAILSVGGNMYSGDVCSSCSNVGFGAGISSRFLMFNKLYFRPEFDFQRLNSQTDQETGLEFTNNTFGLNFNFEFGLHKKSKTTTGRQKTEVFLLLAPLVLHHNPYAVIQGEKTYLAPLVTESQSYSKLIPGVKFGLNFNSLINPKSRFGIQLDYSLLLSDYVDDVSGVYQDYFRQDEITSLAISPLQTAVVGSARGNTSKFDSFIKFTLSFELNLKSSKIVQE